jgi:hypothetical protein
MSNRRKLPGNRGDRARCSFCSRRIGANDDVLRLRTGQIACPRCRQHGKLAQLPCGHYSLPGAFTISDSDDGSNHQCTQCSPHTGLFGAARYGLARAESE